MKNIFFTVIVLFSLFGCSDNKSSQPIVENSIVNAPDSPLVAKAKQLTIKYQLTALAINCVSFHEGDVENGKKRIDVREVHNEKCGGDPKTSPRVFSFQVNMATNEFKTDSHSLSAEFESLDNLSKSD